MNMVYLARKKVKGNTYLYLTKKERVNGKPKVTWQKYLGPEDSIEKIDENIDGFRRKSEFEIKDFGLPIALLIYSERLDLVRIINKKTDKRAQGLSVGEYLLIAILNRCIKPTSKRNIRKWFENTYFSDKFPEIETYLDSNAYTNHFKYLTEKNIEDIESEIREMLVSEFQLEMSEIFYDPTNFYTFINPKNQLLPRHGNSKEGRHVLNIVGLSIFCTHDGGIPIMHKTYPGNIMDAKLFKSEFPRFIDYLQNAGFKEVKTTLIFDKGNISEDVFTEIQGSNIQFICSIRPSTQKELHHLTGDEFEMFDLPNGKKVGLKEFSREMFNERYRLIVSFNPRQNNWNGSVKMKKIEKKILEIKEYFENRLNVRVWRSKDRVDAKIKTILGKNDYLEYLDYSLTGEYGALKLKLELNTDAIDEHIQTLGKSYFITNRVNLKPVEILWLYRQQYTVEQIFKYLKKPNMLQIRPMYHHADTSIQGHIFSNVLGLLLITLLHRDVKVKFPNMSIIKMIDMLSQIKLIQVKTGRKIQKTITGMDAESSKLSKFLGLENYK